MTKIAFKDCRANALDINLPSDEQQVELKIKKLELLQADLQRDPLLFGKISSPTIQPGLKKPIEFALNSHGDPIIGYKRRDPVPSLKEFDNKNRPKNVAPARLCKKE